jgi:hypothetical protein
LEFPVFAFSLRERLAGGPAQAGGGPGEGL